MQRRVRSVAVPAAAARFSQTEALLASFKMRGFRVGAYRHESVPFENPAKLVPRKDAKLTQEEPRLA